MSLTFYETRDFKTTPEYRFYKTLCDSGATDYHVGQLVMNIINKKLDNCIVYDESDLVKTVCIENGLRSDFTSSTDIVVPSDTHRVFSGIYDIWLRNMKNVTSIKLVSKSAGVLYEASCEPTATEFQIPLGFPSGSPVTHWGASKHAYTFLPTYVIDNDIVSVEISSGEEGVNSEAEITLSTICTTNLINRFMTKMSNTKHLAMGFYVNGKTFFVKNGRCMTKGQLDEVMPQKKKWWCF